MAAPTPVVRVTPAGRKLRDGYRSTVACALDTNISFWEKTVKPPGLDGGDAIDTTTMWNDDYRTMAARALVTLTESSAKAGYDPVVTTQILAIINRETTFTYTYSDGSTLTFYGFLKSFEPDELAEGTFPEATISIVPTNYDPLNGVEAGPVVVEVAGT